MNSISRNGLNIKKLFKSESTKFLVLCGLKTTGIYLTVSAFMFYLFWVILSVNNIYLVSGNSNLRGELAEVFLDKSLGIIYAYLPHVFTMGIFLFFIGMYLGKVLIRPFEVIGTYSESKMNENKVTFMPDQFTDYKLLSSFSELFMSYIEKCLKEKKLVKNTIPSKYLKIHQPPFERVFFFHIFILIIIFSVITSLFTIYLSTEVYENLVDLVASNWKTESVKTSTFFIQEQNYIFNTFHIVASSLIFISYLLLSFHLYGKVSGAVFGFFATMRAFMKGNFSARVHLIGYAAIRPEGRKLNKYLDHIVRECTKKNKKDVKSKH